MDDDGRSLRWIVRSLAVHWRAHPAASDGVEGIRRWWFDASHEVPMDELSVALAWMQGRSLIEAATAGDQRVRYRRLAGDAQLDALMADTDGLGPAA
jgi:hypothetical protein